MQVGIVDMNTNNNTHFEYIRTLIPKLYWYLFIFLSNQPYHEAVMFILFL